ncbi:MAG TPA: histone-like nucleoid-structuring protein Lsr2 [Dermatophilaceae bacterium]
MDADRNEPGGRASRACVYGHLHILVVPAYMTPLGTAKERPIAEIPALIRAWARTKGYEVGDRGRIPVQVIEAYDDVHG